MHGHILHSCNFFCLLSGLPACRMRCMCVYESYAMVFCSHVSPRVRLRKHLSDCTVNKLKLACLVTHRLYVYVHSKIIVNVTTTTTKNDTHSHNIKSNDFIHQNDCIGKYKRTTKHRTHVNRKHVELVDAHHILSLPHTRRYLYI